MSSTTRKTNRLLGKGKRASKTSDRDTSTPKDSERRDVHTILNQHLRAYSVFCPVREDQLNLFRVVRIHCDPKLRGESPWSFRLNLRAMFESWAAGASSLEAWDNNVIASFQREFEKTETSAANRQVAKKIATEESLGRGGFMVESGAAIGAGAGFAQSAAKYREIAIGITFSRRYIGGPPTDLKFLIWEHAEALWRQILASIRTELRGVTDRRLIGIVTTQLVGNVGVATRSASELSAGIIGGHPAARVGAGFNTSAASTEEFIDHHGVCGAHFIVFPVEAIGLHKWRVYEGLDLCDTASGDDEPFSHMQKWADGTHQELFQHLCGGAAERQDIDTGAPGATEDSCLQRAGDVELESVGNDTGSLGHRAGPTASRRYVDIGLDVQNKAWVDIDFSQRLGEVSSWQCGLARRLYENGDYVGSCEAWRSAMLNFSADWIVTALIGIRSCLLAPGEFEDSETETKLGPCVEFLEKFTGSRSAMCELLSRISMKRFIEKPEVDIVEIVYGIATLALDDSFGFADSHPQVFDRIVSKALGHTKVVLGQSYEDLVVATKTKVADYLSDGKNGTEKNLADAVALYESVITETASVEALYGLANILLDGGEDVPKDENRAASLYARAVGDGAGARAVVDLVQLFTNGGRDVEMNKSRATSLFEQAVNEYGSVSVATGLVELVLTGTVNVGRDVPGATELFQRTCDSNNERAPPHWMIRLGQVFLSKELGELRDPPRAKELFEHSIQVGSTRTACTELAFLLACGDVGVLKDEQRAAQLLLEAKRHQQSSSPGGAYPSQRDRSLVGNIEETRSILEEATQTTGWKPSPSSFSNTMRHLVEHTVAVAQYIYEDLEVKGTKVVSFKSVSRGIARIRQAYEGVYEDSEHFPMHDDRSKHVADKMEGVQQLGSASENSLNTPKWMDGMYDLRDACVCSGLVDEAEFERGFMMLRCAAQESWAFVVRNPREVLFQMRSRLMEGYRDSWLVQRYLETATRLAPSPRLRPMSMYWSSPWGRQQLEIPFSDEVFAVTPADKTGKIVTVVGRTLLLVDIHTSVVIREYVGHSNDVRGLALSPDGLRIVSGSWDETIRVWDLGSGKQVGEPLCGHSDWVTCVAVSPDGRRIVSGSRDETIRVWDLESGQQVGEPLRGHSSLVSCVAVSPDGRRIVSGSKDETIRVWDVESGQQVGEPLRGHSNWVTCVAMSPDGRRIVSGSEDATIRVWDLGSGKQVGEPLCGHSSWVRCVAVSPDGRRIVSGSEDATIRVWDLESGQQVGEPLCGHSDCVTCVAVSPDCRRIVSGSRDKSIRVWDRGMVKQAGKPLRSDFGNVRCVALSRDGQRLVCGDRDRTVAVWDLASGKQVGKPFRSYLHIESVAISPDERRVVSADWSGAGAVWDLESGKLVGLLRGKGTTFFDMRLAISPDGNHVAAFESWEISQFRTGPDDMKRGILSYGDVSIWDMTTGQLVGDAQRYQLAEKWVLEEKGAYSESAHRYELAKKLMLEEKGAYSESAHRYELAKKLLLEEKGADSGSAHRYELAKKLLLEEKGAYSGSAHRYELAEKWVLEEEKGKGSGSDVDIRCKSWDRTVVLGRDGPVLATLPGQVSIESRWDYSVAGRKLAVALENGQALVFDVET